MAPMFAKDDVKAFYDRFGAKQEAQAFYEDPATADLILHAELSTARALTPSSPDAAAPGPSTARVRPFLAPGGAWKHQQKLKIRRRSTCRRQQGYAKIIGSVPGGQHVEKAKAMAAGRKKAAVCRACHGMDGLSRRPDAPHIAGLTRISHQEAAVIAPGGIDPPGESQKA